MEESRSKLYLLQKEQERELPALFEQVGGLVRKKKVLSCWALGYVDCRGSFQDGLGVMTSLQGYCRHRSFCKRYGAFPVESDHELGPGSVCIGHTIEEAELCGPFGTWSLSTFNSCLQHLFLREYGNREEWDLNRPFLPCLIRSGRASAPVIPVAKPKVLLPVFFRYQL
jgi:phosphoribosylformylglycinamidine synthase